MSDRTQPAAAARSGERKDGAHSRYPPIRDYAIIGDCRTGALVARDGSIDWLCFPQFDDPPVFGAILDRERGGSFSIRPTRPGSLSRRYIGDTVVLETTFRTASGGVARLTDLFVVFPEPRRKRNQLWPNHELLRIVECDEGEVELEITFDPRTTFGRSIPAIDRHSDHWYGVRAGLQSMALTTDFRLQPRREADAGASGLGARVTLRAGQRGAMSLSYNESWPMIVMPLAGPAVAQRLACTIDWWSRWSEKLSYRGPYQREVKRSALTLKLLTYAPSGAIVAALTTSLPEWIGGKRNWDYRFCWLRDASMTLRALLDLGYDKEANAFLDWLLHATRRHQPELRVLYNVHGESRIGERVLEHLNGYMSSRPVREGNGAATQLQLDIYGAVAAAACDYVERGGDLTRVSGRALVAMGEVVCRRWREPDEGIWELRSGRRRHTLSRAMCWVTLDRILRLHHRGRLKAPADRFEAVRNEIRDSIEREGVQSGGGSYVDTLGGQRVDASLLLLQLYGYALPHSPRMINTCDRIQRELTQNGYFYRYNWRDKHDGLYDPEGAFTLCGFWYVQCSAQAGRVEEAERVFEHLLKCGNDLQLYAEQAHPETLEALGNFPQAFSHVGLINAAKELARARRDETEEESRGRVGEERHEA